MTYFNITNTARKTLSTKHLSKRLLQIGNRGSSLTSTRPKNIFLYFWTKVCQRRLKKF